DKELQMMQLNIVALTHLCKLFARDMVKRGSGKILNIGSTGSFQPGPMMAVYCASKAYVLSFTEALANELEGTGVTATALCPGATQSGFQQAAAMEKSKLMQGNFMDSGTVARFGYEALMNNKMTVIPGFMNRALTFSVRFMPRKVVTKVARSIMSPVK
ncbi:MAG: SDR family NAD(P)-dependent oxidoreductase, partial [Tumebacillaceae bacterium]